MQITDRYEALGANVSYVVNGLENIMKSTSPGSDAQTSLLGNWQMEAAGPRGFGLTANESSFMQGTGGDYGVCFEWFTSAGGTGGCVGTKACYPYPDN